MRFCNMCKSFIVQTHLKCRHVVLVLCYGRVRRSVVTLRTLLTLHLRHANPASAYTGVPVQHAAADDTTELRTAL